MEYDLPLFLKYFHEKVPVFLNIFYTLTVDTKVLFETLFSLSHMDGHFALLYKDIFFTSFMGIYRI